VRGAPPRRGGKPAPAKRRWRLGSLLVLVGVLAIFGGTFVAGALAGRLSLRPSAALTPKSSTRAEKPSPAPQPELTFYRELTAPLTPPPPRPAPKPAPKRELPPIEPARPAETPPTDASARAELERAQAANAGVATTRPDAARFTVQVAAYNARAQADALRARLASAGLDAYVTEGETGGVTRYRVRIGAYDTAEEARQAAVRIAAQAQVGTYVTTR